MADMWVCVQADCAWANKTTAQEFVALVDGGAGTPLPRPCSRGSSVTRPYHAHGDVIATRRCAELEGFDPDAGDRWTATKLLAAFDLGDVEARIAAELKRDPTDRGRRCAETARVLRTSAPVVRRCSCSACGGACTSLLVSHADGDGCMYAYGRLTCNWCARVVMQATTRL